jgi:hypothetical protein
MKIAIRPADLDQDKEVLVTTLRRYLTPSSDERRYDWLYRQNPYGPARAWLAEDRETGEIVGSSAAFRRRAIAGGNAKSGWVLGDFCVAERYRSLGPALQLQKATLAATEAVGETEFCYDFPSRQLTAIYGRLGMRPSAQMVRFAKLLRVDDKCRRLTRSKSLSRPLSWMGNLLLRATDFSVGTRKRWEIELQKGECANEFTSLRKTKTPANCIEIERTAEYLNWRYLRHPFFQHQILTARRDGELQGYLVFSRDGDNAQIADWCAGDDTPLLVFLIRDLARRLRKTRTETLSAYLLDNDPQIPVLRTMGFWPRESTPVMMHWPASTGSPARPLRLMYGDRDS